MLVKIPQNQKLHKDRILTRLFTLSQWCKQAWTLFKIVNEGLNYSRNQIIFEERQKDGYHQDFFPFTPFPPPPSFVWKKLLLSVGKENSLMPWLTNFRTTMELLFVLMLETWMEWERQYMQVSSIVPQVNGVIFTPTVQLDPRAGVVSSETETVLNILLACLMLWLQKSNLYTKD